MMINECQSNTMSRTGKNLRSIMLMCGETNVMNLQTNDIKRLTYVEVPKNENWRVPLLKELLEIRQDPDMLEGFSSEEIDLLIHYTCTT